MAVCNSCRSVITFGEDAVELRGDLSLLPPSRSQLFVGAQGKVEGLDFIVLGRVRYGYSVGTGTSGISSAVTVRPLGLPRTRRDWSTNGLWIRITKC